MNDQLEIEMVDPQSSNIFKVFEGQDVVFIIDPYEGTEGFDIKTSQTAIIGQLENIDLYCKRTIGPVFGGVRGM